MIHTAESVDLHSIIAKVQFITHNPNSLDMINLARTRVEELYFSVTPEETEQLLKLQTHLKHIQFWMSLVLHFSVKIS